jgi:hypothetical protein
MSQSYAFDMQQQFVRELVESGHENVVLNFPSQKILVYLKAVLSSSGSGWSNAGTNTFRRVDGQLTITMIVDEANQVVRVQHDVRGTFTETLKERYRLHLNEAFDLTCTYAVEQAAQAVAKNYGRVEIQHKEYNKVLQTTQEKIAVYAF